MVVENEDPEVGRLGKLLLDPPVAAAPDLAVVEVRLRRIDGDDRDAVRVHDRVALAELLLEMHVADVPGIVVSGDDDEPVALDAVEVLLRVGILLAEAERGQIA
jgi:hypothetical protein